MTLPFLVNFLIRWKDSTPKPSSMRVLSLTSLVKAVINGIAHYPEGIFRMSPEGGVDTD